MKRIGLPLIVVLIGVAIVFKFFVGKDKKPKEEKPQPLAVQSSSVFTQSYNQFLAVYFNLKDALVASDTAKANAASAQLVAAAGSLPLDQIKGDTTIQALAKDNINTITGAANTLVATNNITGKRKEFQVISSTLWDLSRAVKYDGQTVYKKFCPMAFGNTGAEWLSNTKPIRNPYFGDEMMECGSIEDSLNYSKH